MNNLTKHMKERFIRLEKRSLWLRERILNNTHLHKDMTLKQLSVKGKS